MRCDVRARDGPRLPVLHVQIQGQKKQQKKKPARVRVTSRGSDAAVRSQTRPSRVRVFVHRRVEPSWRGSSLQDEALSHVFLLFPVDASRCLTVRCREGLKQTVDSVHVLVSLTRRIKNKVTFCLRDVFAEKSLKPSGMQA